MGLWTKKILEDLQVDLVQEPHHLRRSLGPIDLTLLGVGAIIGAGLFSITGVAAAEHAGPAIILSFLIAAIGCAFAGLCYSEIASMIPIAGSAYTYSYYTMGEFTAWLIGWTLVLEYAIGAATVSISWSAYVVSLMHDLGVHLPSQWVASPWQPVHLPDGSKAFGIINLPALLIVMLMSGILIKGIRESAVLNAIIVFIKISVVIIFIAAGVFYINVENYHPFIPENKGVFGEFGWSGILRAAGIIFFAYIGFDAVSTASQEAIKPQKSVPLGIMASLVVCTILYVLFALVMVGLVRFEELNVAAPVALAIDATPFWWLNWLVKLGIIAGLTSVVLVFLLGQSRIFYSMSQDGLLPKVFSDIHPVLHTPWLSNIILMLFVGLFGAFAPIEMVGSMTSIGTLLAFAFVCAGVLILRKTHPEMARPFRTPWVPFVPIMGILVCLLMMISLGLENWARLIVWLAIGMAIYFGYSRKHSIHK